MNSNGLNCTLPQDLDQYFIPVFHITLIVIGIPANCASIFISYLHIKNKNELGVYLFHLSLSDLLHTLILPLWVDYTLDHNNWRFSSFLCMLIIFFMHVNFYASAGFLTCISLDRYIAVVHPLKFHQLRTRKIALCICVIVWTLVVLASGVILSRQQVLWNIENRVLCYEVFPLEPWKVPFNIFRSSFGFLLPLVIMTFCYQRIDAAVKQNQATATDAKRKIRKLLLCILATFFLCFMPYHVIIFIRSIWEPGSCNFASWIYIPYKITLAMATLNCLADPILYCFVSETSQREFGSMVKCRGQEEQISAKQDLEMSLISNKNTDKTMPMLKEDF